MRKLKFSRSQIYILRGKKEKGGRAREREREREREKGEWGRDTEKLDQTET